MAWSDRPWVLDGAIVNVSLIGFDRGFQKERTLDGTPVLEINSDLTYVFLYDNSILVERE